jgi:hypothetical protein
MAGKGDIVRGALEGLADLVTMPKVKQARVEQFLEKGSNPTAVEVDRTIDMILDAPPPQHFEFMDLKNLGDDVFDEMIKFAETGEIPKDQVAKAMVESLFDSGLKDTEARFFIDAAIPDFVKSKGGIKFAPSKMKFGRKDQFGQYRPADEKNQFGFTDEFGQFVPPDD